MKKLKGDVLLYLDDKNVSKVSGIWKALHLSIYIALALNSFITAMAAGNMLQTFKYNCILYCTDIEFEKVVEKSTKPPQDVVLPNRVTDNEIGTTMSSRNDTDFDLNFENTTELHLNNRDLELSNKINETIVFKNETHLIQNDGDSTVIILAKIDMRNSIFSANYWCNFVLGIALISFIFATFCTVILGMCSKGGKGREKTLNRPQNMIYPILVSSVVLGLLNLISSIVVKNGMKDFCANFELFSGQKSCTPLINQFTIHERQTNFYLPYIVLSHTVHLSVILLLFQVIVTFARIIYAADYQLYAIEMIGSEEEHSFEVEDGQIVSEKKL